eukprot:2690919-Rhodomonas_salina.1
MRRERREERGESSLGVGEKREGDGGSREERGAFSKTDIRQEREGEHRVLRKREKREARREKSVWGGMEVERGAAGS